jgi:branched-chain amino acid transport system permease protein
VRRWSADLTVGGALLVAAAALPFAVDLRYVVTQVTVFFIWATVVTQWNLVFGVAGIFSLAQMALFAVGAYVTAVLGFYLHWSLWLAMPAAALATVVVSMLMGLACLRLRGPYVALLTLAIAQVMYVLIVTDTNCFTTADSGCMPLLGGVRGIPRFGDLGFRDLFGSKWIVADYFLALALLAVATVFTILVVRSPLGLAFRALRDNPGYARARGMSHFKYQLWVFALSAFFTGLAGAFHAAHFRIVGPTVFSGSLLLFLLAMMVVGGLGRIWGPIVGTALLMLADEGFKEFSDYRNIGLGLIMALFVILLPEGLTGLIARLNQRRAKPADG